MEQKDNNLKDVKMLAIKGQRLARAIYLVSSFVNDQDPLKWKIREQTICLLVDAKKLGQQFTEGDNQKVTSLEFNIVLNKLNGHLDNLVSLMDLALAGGSISEMNFSILKEETSVLLSSITKELKEKSLIEYVNSDKDNTEVKIVNGIPTNGGSHQIPTPHVSNMSDSKNSFSLGHSHNHQTFNGGSEKAIPVSHNFVQNKVVEDLKKSSQTVKPAKAENKNNRKKIIADFVAGRGWTSIKDIAKAVKGCSEKTIQRLLAEMVDDGTLKKQGERRWSRYMLA